MWMIIGYIILFGLACALFDDIYSFIKYLSNKFSSSKINKNNSAIEDERFFLSNSKYLIDSEKYFTPIEFELLLDFFGDKKDFVILDFDESRGEKTYLAPTGHLVLTISGIRKVLDSLFEKNSFLLN